MVTLNSYAKLNLYLEVLNKRKDNYHTIKTLFERIDLSDRIILKVRRDKLIKIICNDHLVPKGNSNLCYRSARLLQESFKEISGLDIKIIKRIPVGAGLGGGSSNAASVLLGLNKIWRLKLKKQELVNYAKKIGADVAFFLYDAAFAIGEGRGDKIKPLKLQRVKPFWHILIVPKLVVRTALAYKKWDGLNKKLMWGLTKPRYDVNILNLALKKRDASLIAETLFNSLEQVSVKLYPEIKRIKERLAELGLKSILMSGSGPAVMAIVSSRKEALSLSRQLKKQEKSWRTFVTRTT